MLDNFLFWDYENKKNPIEILLKKNSPRFFLLRILFYEIVIEFFFFFFLTKLDTFASKEGNIIEATRVDSATPYYDSSHRTWYRTVSPATGRTRERETKVQGDWERNKGAMVEGERERDYEVVYSLKVVHNFTVGWLLKATEQRERERCSGINRKKTNVLQDVVIFFLFFCFFPSITKRYDVDRTRASRW